MFSCTLGQFCGQIRSDDDNDANGLCILILSGMSALR